MEYNTLDILLKLGMSNKANFIKVSKYLSYFSKVYIQISPTKATYCCLNKSSIMCITLGAGLVKQALALPDKMYRQDIVANFKSILKSYWGFYLHEQGHILFSDMHSMNLFTRANTFNRLNPHIDSEVYKSYGQQLANVFEDVYLEKIGYPYYFPKAVKFFEFNQEKLFDNVNYTESLTLSNFTFFLLYKLRLGKKFTSTNSVWDKHKEKLVPLINKVFRENNSETRLLLELDVLEYLFINTSLSLGRPPKFSSSGVGSGASSSATPSDTSKIKSSSSNKSKGLKGSDMLDSSGNIIDTSNDTTSNSNASNDTTSNSNASNDTTSNSNASNGNASNDSESQQDTDESSLLDSILEGTPTSIDGCLNTDFSIISYPYEKYYAKNIMQIVSLQQVLKLVDTLLNMCKKNSLFIANAFNTSRAQVAPVFYTGFSSGSFDIKAALKNSISGVYNANIFSQKVRGGTASDLAVSILCDVSGSMRYENKSEICTRAMLCFAQACSFINVPLQIACFSTLSEDSSATTIILKDFKDSFNDCKKYLLSSSYVEYSKYYRSSKNVFYHSNMDEVSIHYLCEDFKNLPNKDKILIVISDGQTCGNSDYLREEVLCIEKNYNIKIIGLGILNDAVAKAYNKYKIFSSTEQLNELPKYLTDIILSNAIKNKGVR